jgi:hypothetical protein
VARAALFNGGKTSPALHPDQVVSPNPASSSPSSRSFQSVFLASDDRPLSRREICRASLESGLFPDAAMPTVSEVQHLCTNIIVVCDTCLCSSRRKAAPAPRRATAPSLARCWAGDPLASPSPSSCVRKWGDCPTTRASPPSQCRERPLPVCGCPATTAMTPSSTSICSCYRSCEVIL